MHHYTTRARVLVQKYGGLGDVLPKQIGPMDLQTQNGVVDVLVDNDAEAIHVAKQYLSYFQGPLLPAEAHFNNCDDQRKLRAVSPLSRRQHIIPASPSRPSLRIASS